MLKRKLIREFIPPEFREVWRLIREERVVEELAEELAVRLRPSAPPVVPLKVTMPRVTPFGKGTDSPHQKATVPAGKNVRVFYLKIPELCVGFVQRVANNFYIGDQVYWFLDYELVVSPYIERMLGSVNSPTAITPWKRVENLTEWRVKNNDTSDHAYEVLCDGFYCPVEDVELLLDLGLPVGR